VEPFRLQRRLHRAKDTSAIGTGLSPSISRRSARPRSGRVDREVRTGRHHALSHLVAQADRQEGPTGGGRGRGQRACAAVVRLALCGGRTSRAAGARHSLSSGPPDSHARPGADPERVFRIHEARTRGPISGLRDGRVLGASASGLHCVGGSPASAHAIADTALLKQIRTRPASSREKKTMVCAG